MGDHHPAHIARALGVEVSLIGVAAILAAAVDVRPNAVSGDIVIALLAFAMGIRNATVRGLGVPDLTTTVLTMTLTGLAAESPPAGGSGKGSVRRIAAVSAMLTGALGGRTAAEDEPRPAAGRRGRARARYLTGLRASRATRNVADLRPGRKREVLLLPQPGGFEGFVPLSGLHASSQSGEYARPPWLDLLTEWQATIAAGFDDAPAMCVTTSGRVALGQHQHVLAEGRKEALAQGTAVGCRLSVGGGTDRVPASLAEILHAPTGVADRGDGGHVS